MHTRLKSQEELLVELFWWMSWFTRSGEVPYAGHTAFFCERYTQIELMTGVEVDTDQFGTPSQQSRHAFAEIGCLLVWHLSLILCCEYCKPTANFFIPLLRSGKLWFIFVLLWWKKAYHASVRLVYRLTTICVNVQYPAVLKDCSVPCSTSFSSIFIFISSLMLGKFCLFDGWYSVLFFVTLVSFI